MNASALRRFAIASSLVGALMLVLFVSPGAGIITGNPATNVVPPTGKVAGHGYAYWQQRHWQWVFSQNASTTSPSASHCHILTANGKQVAWLSGPFSTGNHSCSEPAGRPIYVNLMSAECDTFKGEHPGFGTSDSQLELCSKSHFAEAGTPSATVDGQAVNVKALVTATGGFPVHAASGNPLGVPAGNGRAAAYGIGLLLSGFSKGTHTIHCIVNGGAEENLTWTVHVS